MLKLIISYKLIIFFAYFLPSMNNIYINIYKSRSTHLDNSYKKLLYL